MWNASILTSYLLDKTYIIKDIRNNKDVYSNICENKNHRIAKNNQAD